jgi:acyl dehydratase
MVAELTFDDVAEGLEASFAVAVTAAAIDRFAELSGDVCPLHTKGEFAASRGFDDRVVHGAYLAALVSRLVGTQLPGLNAIIHQMQLHFQKPTYVGDTVNVLGRVERKLDPLRAILLSIRVDSSGRAGDARQVATGKVQVGFTAAAR